MMKMRIPALCLSLLSLSITQAGRAALPRSTSDEFKGQKAPQFTLATLNSGSVSLSDFHGKVTLVSFFASWCPPCRSEIAQLKALRQQFGPRGMTIIGAAVDSKLIPTSSDKEQSDVANLVRQLEIPYAVGIAPESLTRDYHFKGIPTTIIIGPDGKIGKTFYGYHDAQMIAAEIERVLPKP